MNPADIVPRTILESFFHTICMHADQIQTEQVLSEYPDPEFWSLLPKKEIHVARMNLVLQTSSTFKARVWSTLGIPDDVEYPHLDDTYFRKIKLSLLSIDPKGLKFLYVAEMEPVEHVRFFKAIGAFLSVECEQIDLDYDCLRENSSDLFPLEAFVPSES